ncbi:MAG: hypothetical protein RLZ55_1224, partial [Actinomycetota bacterium]
MASDEVIEQLRAELAAVRAESSARIEALERQRADDAGRIARLEAPGTNDVDQSRPRADGGHRQAAEHQGAQWTRRALLLGGVGAAAGAVAGVTGASPAAATSGAMQYGGTNNAGGSTTSLVSTHGDQTLNVYNNGVGYALYAFAAGSSAAVHGLSWGNHGVHGVSQNWFGVYGQATTTGSGLVGDAVSGDGAMGRSGT